MTSSSSSCELVNEETERQSLQKQIIRSTKKANYGSLRNETQQKATFTINYKHKLKEGETIQGISLKYGVAIELIKKVNRLWSNDLAFIKDTLIIPLEKDKLKELNLLNEISDCFSESQTNFTRINDDANKNLTVIKDLNSNIDVDKEDKTLIDYLNKFDSFLNESKLKLKSLENCSKLKSSISTNGDFFPNEILQEINEESTTNKKIKTNLNDDLQFSITKNSFSNYLLNDDDLKLSQKLKKGFSSTDLDPEFFLTSPKHVNLYHSNHNLMGSSNSYIRSSRAKLAQENLQRLEKEKDELYEL